MTTVQTISWQSRLVWAWSLFLWLALPAGAAPESRHSPGSRFQSYTGLVMCGYQGWFRAEGDGAGAGWQHFCRSRPFDVEKTTFELWPEVSEYAKTYPTPLKQRDGAPACLFSSWDESTVDTHFRWMREYGIDGVFLQRFFHVTRTEESRRQGRVILANALKSSRQHGRAIAVMYDLSGLRANGEDCSSIIQDWKELVDQLKLTSQGPDQTYLYHRGKPLVAIWGLGFSDRPYDIHHIGIDKLLDFLRHDPEYGGCSILLGVPAKFRTLDGDCLPDPYLHQLLAQAELVMPWMVGRYTPLDQKVFERYEKQVRDDLAWCRQRQLDYVPCIYPGFSWRNLTRSNGGKPAPMNQIPRQKGQFYWGLATTAIKAGAPMLYVAMFDEIDEATAIFKCASRLPFDDVPAKFLDYEGVPADYYLRLTGQAGAALRSKNPAMPQPQP